MAIDFDKHKDCTLINSIRNVATFDILKKNSLMLYCKPTKGTEGLFMRVKINLFFFFRKPLQFRNHTWHHLAQYLVQYFKNIGLVMEQFDWLILVIGPLTTTVLLVINVSYPVDSDVCGE